ncbi:helix-turn-helix transcriptional regulator [Thermicanus aegyptius]|uniref:helix-turn-helix transcriptional regulator n=1 Tax=Thermicanus aegyptius TaxID=94009 RepID=UPI0003FF2001|nr:helix-turn-helix transcriptional regulator [Thermicanus aegyptius]
MRNRLAEIRKDKKMSSEDLAKRLEVTRQTLISIENGRYDPSLSLAFRIAKLFDLAIEDIFIFEEGNKNEE